MGYDYILWDSSNNEIFNLGSNKISWEGLLEYEEGIAALTDPKWLAEWIYDSTGYIREDPEYVDYRENYIPWFSDRLQEFMIGRNVENLQIKRDDDLEWEHDDRLGYVENDLDKKYPWRVCEAELKIRVKALGSRYKSDYNEENGKWVYDGSMPIIG